MRISLILAALLISAQVLAEGSNLPTSRQDRLRAIDKEIEQLKMQIHEYRVAEEKNEVQSQPMKWGTGYIQNLKEAEESEHAEEKLNKRLQNLQQEKENLLKDQQPE